MFERQRDRKAWTNTPEGIVIVKKPSMLYGTILMLIITQEA